MAEAIIFDIDGTLVDSVDLHADAWQKAFHHFGHEIPRADIRSQIGKGGDQLLPVFLKPAELHRIGNQVQHFKGELFKRKYLCGVKPFRLVRELFLKIKNNGQKIALASSAKGNELQAYKRIANIEDLLGAEATSDDVDKSKPHPDIFLAAYNQLDGKIPPEQVVVVGDSPFDAQAARKAGMTPVGVLCGGFPERDLRAAGFVALYADPEDLLESFESSPLARKSIAKA